MIGEKLYPMVAKWQPDLAASMQPMCFVPRGTVY